MLLGYLPSIRQDSLHRRKAFLAFADSASRNFSLAATTHPLSYNDQTCPASVKPYARKRPFCAGHLPCSLNQSALKDRPTKLPTREDSAPTCSLQLDVCCPNGALRQPCDIPCCPRQITECLPVLRRLNTSCGNFLKTVRLDFTCPAANGLIIDARVKRPQTGRTKGYFNR